MTRPLYSNWNQIQATDTNLEKVAMCKIAAASLKITPSLRKKITLKAVDFEKKQPQPQDKSMYAQKRLSQGHSATKK